VVQLEKRKECKSVRLANEVIHDSTFHSKEVILCKKWIAITAPWRPSQAMG